MVGRSLVKMVEIVRATQIAFNRLTTGSPLIISASFTITGSSTVSQHPPDKSLSCFVKYEIPEIFKILKEQLSSVLDKIDFAWTKSIEAVH